MTSKSDLLASFLPSQVPADGVEQRHQYYSTSKIGIVFAKHFCVFAAFLVYSVCTGQSNVNTSGVFFLERDPTLSFPLKTAQVPVSMLYGLSFGIPSAVIFICTILFFKYKPNTREWLCISSGYYPLVCVTFYLLLTLFQCLLLADGITNTIKILVLRPRPNFFAYCNYKGYNDAMTSNNFTSYNSMTIPGVQGSISSCESESTVDPVLSFPSGHSSLSWSAMVFVSLLVKYTIKLYSHFNLLSYHGILVVAPLYLSGWIAITRIQDFYHHCDDVMMGSFIGASCSYFIFTACQPFVDEFVSVSYRKASVAMRHVDDMNDTNDMNETIM